MGSGPVADAPFPIRDAATIVLVRGNGPDPQVLMGQRGDFWNVQHVKAGIAQSFAEQQPGFRAD